MIRGLRSLTAACWRLGLLVSVLAGATGCQGLALFSETLFMMTPAQEVKFGAQVAQQVEKQEPLVTDPQVVDYVREVGKRIVRHSPRTEVPVRFYVVRDDSINAFAIPGGNIYVNTGLIKAADDEAELASVMAHEVGHIARRHGARQVSHHVGADIFKKITLGDNSPQTIQYINSIISQGVLFQFSRHDEFEADTLAVRTLASAGYDPQAMNRLFDKLVQTYGDKAPALKILEPLSRYNSTHPSTRERSTRIEAMTRKFPRSIFTAPPNDLRRVQGRLKQLNLIQ